MNDKIKQLTEDLARAEAVVVRKTVDLRIAKIERDALQAKLDTELERWNPSLVGSLTPEEDGACRAGNKIWAIKAVRERAGVGLKEAKDLVDAHCDRFYRVDVTKLPPVPNKYED